MRVGLAAACGVPGVSAGRRLAGFIRGVVSARFSPPGPESYEALPAFPQVASHPASYEAPISRDLAVRGPVV